MNSHDIRALWTRFFEARGHKRIPSSSLIPVGDPTLLFTTAGMVQLKPWFMGLAEPPARRLISIQKCLRTTDIDEVGDAAHHTFFEMLGNFSVGDYFKGDRDAREGAIPWAWELLASPQPDGLGLDRARLWATIHLDDDDAFELWQKVGIPTERIVRWDESENYWFSGPVGPCGPNTEIYYEFGPPYGPLPACGMPDKSPCTPPLHTPPNCLRFVELWNLVFITLYQAEDGTRTELPQKNVDTGAGLERWPGPLMWQSGVDWRGRPKRWDEPPTNYDTDLFGPIIKRIEELSELKYEQPTGGNVFQRLSQERHNRAMRILADHTRASTFLISEGVMPSNEKHGSVLRRLIRRAMYYGWGTTSEVSVIAEAVISTMSGAHPQLLERKDFILRVLREEENRFNETMARGTVELDAELSWLLSQGKTTLSGPRAFYFAATLGFPLELTKEIAGKQDIRVDLDGYEREFARHVERSRAASRFEGEAERIQAYAELGLPPTAFVGYETLTSMAKVAALLTEGRSATALEATEAHAVQVEVVLDRTPFYAEGGGQVGDKGELVWDGGRFVVEDTQAVGDGGVVTHVGRLVEGRLSLGMEVQARVDEGARGDTMRNHTATHILHAALRRVLGSHVRQAGSYVGPDRLRFDFTHLEAMKPDEIAAVEALANQVVRSNIDVHVDHERYEDAIAGGALAFFGEKYAATVRVVGICEPAAEACFSKELCGGTHCRASGDVGAIIITGETSIGAGMRRIEAVTGRAAAERIRRDEETIVAVSAAMKATPSEFVDKIEALQAEAEALRRRIQALERRSAHDEAEEIAANARKIDGVAVVAARVSAPNPDYLRDLGDGLKAKLGSAVILLGAEIEGKPSFLAMSTQDVAKKAPAGDIVRAAAQTAGGGGGGRPELAQGGGTDPSKLDAGLAAGRDLAETRLRG